MLPKPCLRAVWVCCLALATFLLAAMSADGADSQMLHGHLPPPAARQTPLGPLDSTQRLKLAVGLPLRNQEALTKLLRDLYDPLSSSYRHFLTPAQFTEQFAPTEADYERVAKFASDHGLTITQRHSNRLLLDVEGAVAGVEDAFHVKLRTYRHPTEARDFFAPDVEPSVDPTLPILHVSGLDNYALPHPNLHAKPVGMGAKVIASAGSAPSGTLAGSDFRAAYVPDATLTGTGQSVGLLQFDGYYPSDITAYKQQFGLPGVNLINVPIDGGVATPGSGNIEVCLDIEMAMSMAPGLSNIYVYEAPPATAPWVDMLNRMATDNLAKQLSCSWTGGLGNSAGEQIFQQMAAQGQSFFCASGDSDAYYGTNATISFPADSPNVTAVGATTLTTGTGGVYTSETAWNWQNSLGTSGGVSATFALPSWQSAVSMSGNGGSTTMRNIPDVAMVGDNVYVRYGNGAAESVGGTSCAAPLWAAFTALVNQQVAAQGGASVGFLNPAIYATGNSSAYGTLFHDVATGNNFSTASPQLYPAVSGYDLCTGWGTPVGNASILGLAKPLDGLQVSFSCAGGQRVRGRPPRPGQQHRHADQRRHGHRLVERGRDPKLGDPLRVQRYAVRRRLDDRHRVAQHRRERAARRHHVLRQRHLHRSDHGRASDPARDVAGPGAHPRHCQRYAGLHDALSFLDFRYERQRLPSAPCSRATTATSTVPPSWAANHPTARSSRSPRRARSPRWPP